MQRADIEPEFRDRGFWVERPGLICLLLAAITLAAYWPATGFEFLNYDDQEYVVYNKPIQNGITAASVAWALKTGHASNWHPVTWVSHMLDCALYGLKPWGHHLTNILLHAANAVLVFLVLRELTGVSWRSALVAALFAWHPLHVESVAWVAERKDVLSGFFWLLTLGAYARYARDSGGRSPANTARLYYVLALCCFALGLMAKPMLVTLPFVLLLLDYWPLKRTRTIARLIWEKAPFLALSAMDCGATVWAQHGSNSVVPSSVLPLSARIANALVSYARYLGKMVWPSDLITPYPYPDHWPWGDVIGAGILLTVISGAVILRLRRQPWLAVGWFWFLGTLAPVIGLVQAGMQSMADRYTYMPSIGAFFMVAWSIPRQWTVWPRPGFVFGGVTAGVLLFLVISMEAQLQYWRNSVTLFSHTVEVTGDCILAEYDLAEALAERGDEQRAIEHYRKALAIRPNRVEALYNSQVQAHFNLGMIYRIHEQWADAEAQFRACLLADPGNARARRNLELALARQGKSK